MFLKAYVINYGKAFASAFNARKDFLKSFFFTNYIYPYAYFFLVSLSSITVFAENYFQSHYLIMHCILVFISFWLLVDFLFFRELLNNHLIGLAQRNNDLYFDLVHDFILLEMGGFGIDSTGVEIVGGAGGADSQTPSNNKTPSNSKIPSNSQIPPNLRFSDVNTPSNNLRNGVNKVISEASSRSALYGV